MTKLVSESSVVSSNCLDEKENLSSYDVIFLSASSGSGKTQHLSQSQVLRFSHRLTLILTTLHNRSTNFWIELFDLCVGAGWIKSNLLKTNSKEELNQDDYFVAIQTIANQLNKRSEKYTQKDSLYIVFENSHVIQDSDLLQQLAYFVQLLNSSIKCIFSGRDQILFNIIQDATDKKAICFKENDFLVNKSDFNHILSSQVAELLNRKSLEKIRLSNKNVQPTNTINALYNLVGGHVGLGIRCIETDYLKNIVEKCANLTLDEISLHLIQSEEVDDYFYQLTKTLDRRELDIISLPLLNRALLTKLSRTHDINNNKVAFYRGRGLFNSSDQINFYPKSLFRHWLNLNVEIGDTSILLSAIEIYRQNDCWPQAIECAIKLGIGSLATDLVCQAARHFSSRGQYQQARLLINQLPKIENQPLLILSLFENLLDFQQYGHQVANSNLQVLITESQGHVIDQQSQELIALLQHHYAFLLSPDKRTNSQLSIAQYKPLFDRENEFCAWAWHSLAMEQVLAGDHVSGLDSIIKAIYWSLQQFDAPCALASLAWRVVPCLQQGKLSFALEYCNQIENWLKKNQLHDFAMVSTVHRVRIIIYREQGKLALAEQELASMQRFYPSLDPLNLAYCYWAELVLSLAQKNFELARKQLFILEGHVTIHFNDWQLVLPKPELLSAILDTLAGSELSMLNWASQFQLEYIDNNDAWLNAAYLPFQSEVIAYLRVRITLGSDMSRECDQLIERAELAQDRLLALHCIILLLLNASRQSDEAMINHYRHLLLNKAGILEFHQVYKEYLDDLLPLLLNYQVLPSELTGYEKIVPSSALASKLPIEIAPSINGIHDSKLFLSLTARESEIARLVLEGLSNKEIAVNLKIGLATVKGHVSNVYQKLGVKRRTQLSNLVNSNN
jgi:ATP/maltotriose-dependent transcriptional regulator MalT